MKNLTKPLILAVTVLITVACANQPMLNESEAYGKYKNVAELDQLVKSSDQESISLLAQNNYAQALEKLEEAKDLAIKDDPRSTEVAARGILLFRQAETKTAQAKDILQEVLEQRNKAIQSGAMDLTKDQADKLEKEFREITLGLENGEIEQAKVRRPEMIRRYAELELSSLKTATVEDAKKAIQKARDNDAHKYAKKIFENAKNELSLAISLLDADKQSKAKAEQHAEKAIFLADQSISITDMVKEFRANDFSLEDIVVWHEGQMEKAIKPLNKELPVNKPNHHMVAFVANSIDELQTEKSTLSHQRDQLKEALAKSEIQLGEALTASKKELTDMKAGFDSQLSKLESAQKNQEALNAKNKQKLEYIQSLYSESEATVYRQRDDILIRAQGFYFATGQSEIDSRNFNLLSKIAKSIEMYPHSKVVVTGHTDSQGNDDLNMSLSKERAQKVAKFLNEVGGISADRLNAEGFGETKPVANNETIEGRAANRRVEILIINNH